MKRVTPKECLRRVYAENLKEFKKERHEG